MRTGTYVPASRLVSADPTSLQGKAGTETNKNRKESVTKKGQMQMRRNTIII